MVVHAHPDDEGAQTGGLFVLAAQRGIRTVLVTCTNGEMGDSPEGLKPEAAGHDPAATAELRLRELEEAVKALLIDHVELLGYRDSGMMGWPQNDDPGCLWRADIEGVTARVAELMVRYRPEVVVTYDDNGLYGHPDHIQAHRATVAAATRTGIPEKLYEIAFPLSLVRALEEMERQSGGEVRAAEGADPPFGTPDELITTTVDVSSVWDQKRLAIFAHNSQLANFGFLKVDPDLLKAGMATEYYIRRFDRTGSPLPETDLFAGVQTAAP